MSDNIDRAYADDHSIKQATDIVSRLNAEINKLRAENERLREAMRPIAKRYEDNDFDGLAFDGWLALYEDIYQALKEVDDG